MDTRRSFLKKASALSGGAAMLHVLPISIQKALAINPAAGSSFYDAEHVVFLMQENRSFDHAFGTLQGVRGFNDPRAITLPNKNKVWVQTSKEGESYAPFHLDIKDTKITWMGCLPHGWDNQSDARNGGKYDQWLDVKHSGEEAFKNMPLTMGYYTREDIPFYYSLADAFTVCDQHFCSSLTGTTANRLHFWTGTIREQQDPSANVHVWNQDTDHEHEVNWKTFPERLEENGVSWKFYQNEIDVPTGLSDEGNSWLANFGCNPLECFKEYHVRLSPEYIAALPLRQQNLEKEIEDLDKKLLAGKLLAKEKEEGEKTLKYKHDELKTVIADQQIWTKEKYESLSDFHKSIHQKAFTNNRADSNFHELTSINYKEGSTERELNIPKGDILHQFREDVQQGKLPTVSWLAAPQYFSDHPDSPWFGAWYVSEVLDILTANPEVWKKTIFILTYDENDGYFDHFAPFVSPHPEDLQTGKVSEGIDTHLEHVGFGQQSSEKKYAREGPIGLGFRVPLVIASPWSRGGFVNSEVFDHTSSLQFLEKFLEKKLNKSIREENINNWRRTVCGDLSSVFRPYNGEKISKPLVLERKKFIKDIYNAKFKGLPRNYKKLSSREIEAINAAGSASSLMPKQEKGIRQACALSYELYVNGNIDEARKKFQLSLKADNKLFGDSALGSPFYIYSLNPYKGIEWTVRHYTASAGSLVKDEWDLEGFEKENYHFRLWGPNGFYREFSGNAHDALAIECGYGMKDGNPQVASGNLVLSIMNRSSDRVSVTIKDNSYKMGMQQRVLSAGEKISLNPGLLKSYGWYDFTVSKKGEPSFLQRFAGHVETGKTSWTDPLMGS